LPRIHAYVLGVNVFPTTTPLLRLVDDDLLESASVSSAPIVCDIDTVGLRQ
jgi:hypothetical protein